MPGPFPLLFVFYKAFLGSKSITGKLFSLFSVFILLSLYISENNFSSVALLKPSFLYISMRVLELTAAFAAIASATAIPTKHKRAADASKLEFFGVNESGAEFGTAIPGVYGTVCLLLRLGSVR